jgi:DNA-binding LytR/AlgR family response regulator
MNSKVPAYLYEKSNVIRLILLTAIFALLFINIFQPFGSREWYPNVSDFKYFFFSSIIILVGMLVVVVSRLLMLSYTKNHSMYYWQYALWILSEVLAMSIFYTLYTKYMPEEGKARDIIEIFQKSTINTSLVLLLPYSILWLYFSWLEKTKMLERFVEDELVPDGHKKNLIGFYDEKGELKISVALENLLFIDSSDNYITVHYINKGKIAHFLIRNTLKWIDENCTKETPLVRCHRSFVVNLDQVKVLRKTKEGIFLELEALTIPDIPVSKTFYSKVVDKFSRYSL